MLLDNLGKKPTNKQVEEAEKIKAFLQEINEVETKHGIQTICVLDFKPTGITPSFQFVKKEKDASI